MLVPAGYAMDNDTAVLGESSADYYFDSNVENDNGDGSIYNPYKTLTSDRIKDNSIIHLANGEYELDWGSNPDNVSIKGTDASKTIISYSGIGFDLKGSLSLSDVTLSGLGIRASGNNLTATNTIFKDFSSASNNAINSKSNVILSNCSFISNSAGTGGAIYMNGGTLTISDSLFKDNAADKYGGAIACEDGTYIEIDDSKFLNDYSNAEAGGAIYLKDVELVANNVEIINCSAPFGGAIASLNSKVSLNNFTAKNNRAKYYGGAVYSLYHSFEITHSALTNNSAGNGGAIFADGVSDFIINNNVFTDNSASIGSAVFSQISDFYYDSLYDKALNNKFVNNDAYVNKGLNLTFNNNQHILFKLNASYNGSLPSYYNLRDLGQVSTVKNQGSGGNCWAFSSLAALESAILKSTGIEYDLSEENMKNIMSFYSTYGWSMENNVGGYDKMGVGYLTSWLGPVNESDDAYDSKSLLSPLIASFVHVQNIVFLTRSNFTDNDAIKKSIMDYGAVATSIYWSSSYLKGKNYYYSGSTGANHAVAIVGWDDNYSASNFRNTPPGDGAWIIKNSWGTSGGDKGFYYVSYYDTKFSQPGKYVSYAIILNDTIKYDKIYQYDVQGRSDIFLNYTNTVWYKNKFEATSDEYLSAVSTYFEKSTDWELSVYVNDALKLTKSGKAIVGYSTIDLGKFIPIKTGDIFEVVFKVTVDANASVPISEAVSFNEETYHENISFISYDGKNWVDFYDLEWTFPDHTYASQVACIKAFTISNPLNTQINLTLTNRGKNSTDIIATVFDEYDNIITHGTVVFSVGGAERTVAISNGIAKYSNAKITDGINNYSARFSETGYNPSSNFVLVSNNVIDTNISLTFSSVDVNPVTITANINGQNGNPVEGGEVVFTIEGVNYTVSVENGYASLTHTFKSFGVNNILAAYRDAYSYGPSQTEKTIEISLHDARVDINVDSQYNPVTVTVNVVDENGNKVNAGNVVLKIEGSEYTVGITDGKASLTHVFTRFGSQIITAAYSDDSYNYNSNNTQKDISVNLKNTNLEIDHDYNANNPVNLTCTITDGDGNPVDTGKVYFNFGDETREVDVADGVASIEYVFKNTGINDVSVSYVDGYYYADSSKNISLNVSKIPVGLSVDVNQIKDSLTITINLSQALDEYVVVYVNDEYNILKSSKGQAVLNLNSAYPGTYLIKTNVNSLIYDSGIVEKEFKVKERSTTIICDTSKLAYDKVLHCSVVLEDEFGYVIPNSQVSMTVGGKTYSAVTNESGVAVFKFTSGIGTASAVFSFKGDENYQKSSLTKKLTIDSSVQMPTAAKYTYNADYEVKLVDGAGNVVKTEDVNVLVDSKDEFTVSTDSKGILHFNISLSVGSHTITVTNPETGEVKSQTISVAARINGNKALTMYYGSGSAYKVRVYDDNGNIAKGVEVTFKIDGRIYSRITDSNGYASLKITLAPKTYTITASYKDYKVSNKVVVKPTLILKDKTVKKSKTFKYTVKLLNNKGKILKYKYVKVKFKGKTFKAKTNSKGIATFKLKSYSKVGKFTLTATYGSAKISKKITVKK